MKKLTVIATPPTGWPTLTDANRKFIFIVMNAFARQFSLY
jgi:hypothetical protein